MKTSVIRVRVADFLKHYPPFDALPEDDLLEIAGSGRVKFHQADEYVLRQGQPKSAFIWIVQQGRVDLVEECVAGEQMRDIFGEGDLLGLERFLGDGSSLYSARTASDVILYGISADLFEKNVQRYPAVKRYLRAHFTVSSVSGVSRTSWLDAEPPPEDFLRARLVAVSVHASDAEVCSRLTGAANRVVAVVEESCRPVGVMTAADLMTSKASDTRVVLRPWPAAVASPITTRAAVRALIETRSAAVAVTADGTLDSPLEGILTVEELALFSGQNPVSLIGAIRSAASVAEVRPLLRQAKRVILDALAQPHDVDDCSRIGTEVATALGEACLEQAQRHLAIAGVVRPDVPWCCFSFGAAGRHELLEPAAPSLGIVYDHSCEVSGTQPREYFNMLAEITLDRMAECGVAAAGGARPDRPKTVKSLSEWKQLYVETICNPLGHNLYARRDLFDLAPLAGETNLLDALRKDIRAPLREQVVFMALLANDTLAHLPPLTFFRGLVVELDGAQRETLDIGATAITPITDAARVFAIAGGHLTPSNTLHRLQMAEVDFADRAAIFADAAEAFRIAQYYRSLVGSATIAPWQLGKFDQRLLKTAFSSIQRLLEFTASTFIKGA
jgi:CBS domain-containing protein